MINLFFSFIYIKHIYIHLYIHIYILIYNIYMGSFLHTSCEGSEGVYPESTEYEAGIDRGDQSITGHHAYTHLHTLFHTCSYFPEPVYLLAWFYTLEGN